MESSHHSVLVAGFSAVLHAPAAVISEVGEVFLAKGRAVVKIVSQILSWNYSKMRILSRTIPIKAASRATTHAEIFVIT
jgi:hypothetical protein